MGARVLIIETLIERMEAGLESFHNHVRGAGGWA